jgi:hypothetical protein
MIIDQILKPCSSGLNSIPLSKSSVYISYVTPMLFWVCDCVYCIFKSCLRFNFIVFICNQLNHFGVYQAIQCEIANSTAIDKTIHQYSLLLQKRSFKSEKLVALQQN